MSEIVTVVYEQGVLRPLTPLKLPEHQTLRIQVLSDPSEEEDSEIIQLLVNAGLIRPRISPTALPPDPVPEAERRRLADLAGQIPGKPLSEIILEDREPR